MRIGIIRDKKTNEDRITAWIEEGALIKHKNRECCRPMEFTDRSLKDFVLIYS